MKRLLRDECGAMAIVTVVFAVFLVALLYYLIGIGQALLYRQRMQDAADAVAFASAVMHARGMNLIALINVIMAALLAVLVAFRIVETLVLVAMVVIAAASVFPPNPGGFALVGTLETFRQTVSEAREVASRIVHPTLAMLHTTELLVRDLTPATATALAAHVVDNHYAPPARVGVAVPTQDTLPLDTVPFPVLCEKSAELVGELTLAPLEEQLGGVGRVALSPVRAAVEGLASSAPDWFCGDGAAKTTIRVDKGYPQLPAQARCLGAVGDIGEGSAGNVTAACDDAETETLRSAPDEDTGECLPPDCDPALYELRAAQARKACDPNEHEDLHSHVVQVRTTRYGFVKNKPISQRPVTSVELALSEWKHLRCKRDDGHWVWNRRLRDDDDEIIAVCPVRTTTLRDMSVEVVEVLHVFGCSQRTVMKAPVDGAADGVTSESATDPEAAHRLSSGVALGDETFQVRSVVIGERRGSVSRRVLEVASYGTPPPEAPELAMAPELARIAVAQAEYYFDEVGADASAAMWTPKWQARLRRFRWPEGEGLEATCALADAVAEDVGTTCRAALQDLKDHRTWLAH
jgi:hypothetical protein